MNKIRTLIIDDEFHQRQELYGKIFRSPYFDIAGVGSMDDLVAQATVATFDLYVIDLYLDDKIDLDQALSLIPKPAPIVMLTGREADKYDGFNKFRDRNILWYLFLNNLRDGNEGGSLHDHLDNNKVREFEVNLVAKIRIDLKMEFHRLNPSSVRLLHLSDLHFGHRDMAIGADDMTIPVSYLREHGSPPDFIVISGDITYSADQSQFADAERWIRKMWEYLGGGEWKNRTIISPGNHDYSLTHAIPSEYIMEYGGTAPIRRSSPEADLFDLGWTNYLHFVHSLIGVNSLCHSNTWFSRQGIVFYSLNSMSNASREMVCGHASKLTISDELLMGDKSIPPSCTRIICMHHGKPQSTTSEAMVGLTNWTASISRLQALRPSMIMFGHSHSDPEAEECQNGNTDLRKCILANCPTPWLNNSGRSEGASRGFSAITLDLQKRQLELRPWSFKSATWTPGEAIVRSLPHLK